MYNSKERLTWCPSCREYISTKEPAPTCSRCKGNLITVVQFADGHKTGDNELAK